MQSEMPMVDCDSVNRIQVPCTHQRHQKLSKTIGSSRKCSSDLSWTKIQLRSDEVIRIRGREREREYEIQPVSTRSTNALRGLYRASISNQFDGAAFASSSSAPASQMLSPRDCCMLGTMAEPRLCITVYKEQTFGSDLPSESVRVTNLQKSHVTHRVSDLANEEAC